LVECMKSFSISPRFKDACSVIELPAGIIFRTKTSAGDQIQIKGSDEKSILH